MYEKCLMWPEIEICVIFREGTDNNRIIRTLLVRIENEMYLLIDYSLKYEDLKKSNKFRNQNQLFLF